MKKNIKWLFLLVFVIVILAAGCTIKKKSSEAVDLTSMSPTYRDVLIDTVTNDDGTKKDLKMNVFVPPTDTSKKAPVLVYVHGGGWAKGDYQGDDVVSTEDATAKMPDNSGKDQPTDQMSSDNASSYKIFKSILNNGIAFVSVDYRLNSEAAFPAQIYDIKGAIRYIRAHADEYGIDPDKIAIVGSSAGAHLATELATTSDIKTLEGDVGGNLEYSSSVIAAIDFYGPTDLLTMAPEMSPSLQSKEDAISTHDAPSSNESKLIGFSGEGEGIGVLREIRDANDTSSPYWDKVELAELASPINHITSDDPPIFIAHGGHDTLVPIEQSLRLREALAEAGVESIFMSNADAPHGYQGQYVNNAALTWITDKLFAD
ncbi:alpha/beta hydrolase fold domain-containing protein [Lacrimispora sp. 38-1]|uniref:alpha/beta hydrolase fold domain-containing protein n=1 Tax=Lacrimispora sp. 38-1 TaxID=3125778 RepID=UPI003CFBA4D3